MSIRDYASSADTALGLRDNQPACQHGLTGAGRRCRMRKLIVVIALVVTVVPIAAQKWTPPRTPWGDPDLQGLWPTWQLLSVPLERPVELGTKATLAEEEFRRLPAQSRVPGANDVFNQGG